MTKNDMLKTRYHKKCINGKTEVVRLIGKETPYRQNIAFKLMKDMEKLDGIDLWGRIPADQIYEIIMHTVDEMIARGDA